MKILVTILIAITITLSCVAQPSVPDGSVTGGPAAINGIMLGNAPGWSTCRSGPDLCDVGRPSFIGTSEVQAIPSPDGDTWVGLLHGTASGECASTTITGLITGVSYTLQFFGANFGNGFFVGATPPSADFRISVGPIAGPPSTSQIFNILKLANTWNTYTMPFIATNATMMLSVENEPGSQGYLSFDGFTAFCSSNLDLGNDTLLCQGDTLTLDAMTVGATSYLWQDGSTTASTFKVSQADTYKVDVDLGGCVVTDSIIVDFVLPIDALANDTTLCQGESLTLDATTAGATSYNWQNGASTDSVFNVSGSDRYGVEVIVNGCSGTDSINVSFTPLPIVNLGNDTILCPGATLTLNAITAGATSYLWQDVSTNPTFNVSGPGRYGVEVIANNCNGTDSIEVSFNQYSQLIWVMMLCYAREQP